MKIKVGVIFGGKSVEHEISIITASQVINSIDKEKYEVVPIYISKAGKMYTGKDLLNLNEFRDIDNLLKKSTLISLVSNGKTCNLLRVKHKLFSGNIVDYIDVAFPIMHGTNGEDGSIQGFLEILNIPYVGPDVLSSSIGMDKIMMRRILKESGIPSLDYFAFYSLDFIKDEMSIIKNIENKIEYPVIVKAANLGSSVGIKTAKDREELKDAIMFAFEYSDRIMVEKAITNLKEINCSVIGDMIDAEASVCEEPVRCDEILSYQDKYVGGNKSSKGMASLQRKIPADISDKDTKLIKDLAIKTFKLLGASGVARIDFMKDMDSKEIFVNEINTIPGALSYYLWEANGKDFKTELNELISLAFKRQRERNNRIYSYDQNILTLGGGTKGVKGKLVK